MQIQKPGCQQQGAERVANIYKDQISLIPKWVNGILVRERKGTHTLIMVITNRFELKFFHFTNSSCHFGTRQASPSS
jgi:hypothetical protein